MSGLSFDSLVIADVRNDINKQIHSSKLSSWLAFGTFVLSRTEYICTSSKITRMIQLLFPTTTWWRDGVLVDVEVFKRGLCHALFVQLFGSGKEHLTVREQGRGSPVSVTYLWYSFDTKKRSSETEVKSSKSCLMKYSVQKSMKLPNVSQLVWRKNLFFFYITSLQPDENLFKSTVENVTRFGRNFQWTVIFFNCNVLIRAGNYGFLDYL